MSKARDLAASTFTDAIAANGGIYLGGTGSENLLDDVETGTFTPSLGDGSNNATLSTANGRYTKIGNQVTVHVGIYFSSKASATGGIRIYGLPFAPISDFTTNYSHSGGAIRGFDGGLSTPHNCITASSYLYFVASNGSSTVLTFSSLNSSGAFFGSLTYTTA